VSSSIAVNVSAYETRYSVYEPGADADEMLKLTK